MAYIRGQARHESCFLCDKAAAGPDDAADLVLRRETRAYALLNLFPYNTGHLMVAPTRHVAGLHELDDDETLSLWRLVGRSTEAVRRAIAPDGFNIGINLGEVAGAGVPGHLHVHVVPRWSGDANFMPVVAETKVLPEMLEETYRSLRPAFDSPTGA
jgi:ATP adenylyltransferase